MSVGDIVLSGHVDGIEHSIDIGIVLYLFYWFVHGGVVIGGMNLVFIKLNDSVLAVGLMFER